jgi:WhiB family redox-sensing transcriptional regulator
MCELQCVEAEPVVGSAGEAGEGAAAGMVIVDLTPEALEALAYVLRDEAWKRDALCLEYPDVDYFPASAVLAKPAQAVCRQCLVREECLAYAVAEGITQGVWGGLTGAQRRRTLKAA